MKTEIYLDPTTCKKLELSYWEDHDESQSSSVEPISVRMGDLLSANSLWDYRHRQLFASFVLSGELMYVRPSPGPGWFEVLNTATKSFMPSEPQTFQQVLLAD